ncbi:MAG: deoxyguanosinetriphosphate triphosphohydrolase [Clostridia bacterium]|nr:deoxyguanosinetriphosphate triphosphohydrolase [Clostridia bacterium]
MNIREQREQLEHKILSDRATFSDKSRGRQKCEDKCILRTEFARDRDRIIHSKAFRRLKHKTQVFISLDNDHFRTRLTHTLEVSQIARTIARALCLNEDLVEAIALGHDLGHTPFGHSGERALDELSPKGFKHYEQSLRVVDILEKNGEGMNLTYEVRDGIVSHTGENLASTDEGLIVKFSDRFAYINHDIDDAIRAGVIGSSDIPQELINSLGSSNSERIDNLISDIVLTSLREGKITMSPQIHKNMMALRSFMFENVYNAMSVRDSQSYMVIEKLYNYFTTHIHKLPDEYRLLLDDWEPSVVVCDYIAGMTDNYCVNLFNDLFMPIK